MTFLRRILRRLFPQPKNGFAGTDFRAPGFPLRYVEMTDFQRIRATEASIRDGGC